MRGMHSDKLSYVRLLEDRIANLETKLRQSNPSIASDHLQDLSPENAADESLIQISEPLDGVGEGSPPGLDLPSPEGLNAANGWLNDPFEEPSLNTFQDVRLSFGTFDVDQLVQNWPLAAKSPEIRVEDRVTELCDPVDDFEEAEAADQSGLYLDMMSEQLSKSYTSQAVASRYVGEYFTSAHPMWPFLHQRQWNSWWKGWTGAMGNETTLGWRAFFVDMVLSIGALLANSSDPSFDHMNVSKSAYQRAMGKYPSLSTQGESAALKTQSSLLLTVHAMHLDSVGELFQRASEAIRNCALSKKANRVSKTAGRGSDMEEIIHKMTLRTCVVIDILLSNSMDHKVCFDNDDMQDEALMDIAQNLEEYENSSISSEEAQSMFFYNNVSPSPLDVALEEHMFWLRRIQYRILRITNKLERESLKNGNPTPNLWRSRPKHDLERWTQGIAGLHTSLDRQRRFLSLEWLRKLANYTVISLFPNPLLAVRSGDSRHLVAAACSVLITFRRLRVKDQTTCHTWTALLHQFQAAITVIFCLWATPTHQQAEFYDQRALSHSLFSGMATLVDFSTRWEPAHVLRNVFELLTESLPISEFGNPFQQWSLSPDNIDDLDQMIVELEELKAQPKVVSMLRTMMRGPRPQYTPPSVTEIQWIQYEHQYDCM
ncbi:unnamed protein product [Clonostachys solani]|uniref:Transcription factor domain-containing protein n=1 Tax=Clonostachys solani TaxID=160281 RepID=A0A9P0EQ91_9HYPO|nr:unnamed protein product [Clonostachys solani]